MPLFSGCDGRSAFWKPWKVLFGKPTSIGVLLLPATGLRPGELGQLQIDDFTEKKMASGT